TSSVRPIASRLLAQKKSPAGDLVPTLEDAGPYLMARSAQTLPSPLSKTRGRRKVIDPQRARQDEADLSPLSLRFYSVRFYPATPGSASPEVIATARIERSRRPRRVERGPAAAARLAHRLDP